jgi:NADH dehydrogenase/NADH:ubiquinone oxidoreductase subunit G
MGALTSKPYAFNARPWELRSFESVDFFDSVGASIRLDLRGLTLMRVLPYINESINEEWITDKVRFSYDGLKYQRLVAPLYRVQQKFVKLSWPQFYYQLMNSLLRNRSSLGADLLVGQFIDSRSFLSIFSLLKTILSLRADKSKVSVIHRELLSPSSIFFSAYRSSYANFNWETLRMKKQLLLIDTNLRLESPLLNLKVRRSVLNQGLNVYSFGFQSDLLYPVYNLGSTTSALVKFFEGRHALSRVIMNVDVSNSNLLLFYSHLALRLGKEALLSSFFKVINRASPFKLNAHYLNHSISTFGVLDMVGKTIPAEYKPKSKKKSILWCMGEDEICFDANNYDTVVYAGHHGDHNAVNATFLIPSMAPFEKSNHFVNILGVNRNSTFVVNGPHLALSEEFFAHTFRSYIYSLLFSRASFSFDEKDMSPSVSLQFGFFNDFKGNLTSSFFNEGKYLSYSSVINEVSIDTSLSYYADNSIVRASHVMALAQSRFKRYKTNFHS